MHDQDGFPVNLCGTNLKRLREERKLRLIDIQASLRITYGISLDRTNLGRIERGKRSVSDVELAVLARILDVPLSDLLWGKTAPNSLQEMVDILHSVEARYKDSQ